MLEDNERIVIPDPDGEGEHVFEVMFTFEIDDTEKTYVVVTPVVDDEEEEDEEVEIFAFQYEESADDPEGYTLHQIESDEEWEVVEETIATLLEEDETLLVDDKNDLQ
ncbi:DUF1292 domain-containing protein [Geomicrobium sp. JCM 19039]|uniref:DUF1292 domain-containing protein n=1 Tax=Geomicrobium sp. JCM 19039 TaxID=1460636 RepID=UPI00045F3BFB|nr:DUF1292 domain-containing protein [Geomicrobium sp. JCM 19039]GAK11343.1 hypothetical protein JCM19039_1032 [Geomicrobium sp. JCM 19039]